MGTTEQIRRRLVESGYLPAGQGSAVPLVSLPDAVNFVLAIGADVELRALAQSVHTLSTARALPGAIGVAGDAVADLLAHLAAGGAGAALDGEVVINGRAPFLAIRSGLDGKPKEEWFGHHDLVPQTWRTHAMRRLSVIPFSTLAAIVADMAAA